MEINKPDPDDLTPGELVFVEEYEEQGLSDDQIVERILALRRKRRLRNQEEQS